MFFVMDGWDRPVSRLRLSGMILTRDMKLSPPGADDAEGPLKFERRRHPRHEANGPVTALRRDHDVDAHRYPICAMELVNISQGGLAAITGRPLTPNEEVTVYFPREGISPQVALDGYVVRCEPNRHTGEDDRPSTGYEVGICFELPHAA